MSPPDVPDRELLAAAFVVSACRVKGEGSALSAAARPFFPVFAVVPKGFASKVAIGAMTEKLGDGFGD